MSSRELLTAGLRVLGVFFAYLFLQNSLQFILSVDVYADLGGKEYVQFVATYLAQIGVMFIMALMLVLMPGRVASWLTPDAEEERPGNGANGKEIQGVLLSVLGVYILSWSIPDLADNAVSLIYSDALKYFGEHYQRIRVALGITFLEILIGVYLTFQGHALSELILRLRSAGYARRN